MQNILITTAISYTNGNPHIGHLYESVLADFLKKSVHKQANLCVFKAFYSHASAPLSIARTAAVSSNAVCSPYPTRTPTSTSPAQKRERFSKWKNGLKNSGEPNFAIISSRTVGKIT